MVTGAIGAECRSAVADVSDVCRTQSAARPAVDDALPQIERLAAVARFAGSVVPALQVTHLQAGVDFPVEASEFLAPVDAAEVGCVPKRRVLRAMRRVPDGRILRKPVEPTPRTGPAGARHVGPEVGRPAAAFATSGQRRTLNGHNLRVGFIKVSAILAVAIAWAMLYFTAKSLLTPSGAAAASAALSR